MAFQITRFWSPHTPLPATKHLNNLLRHHPMNSKKGKDRVVINWELEPERQWIHWWRLCIPTCWIEWPLIDGGGVWKAMEDLMFAHTLRFCEALLMPFFPWKSIWWAKGPKRFAFFVWRATWGKIITYDGLWREAIAWLIGAVYVGEVGRLSVVALWCCTWSMAFVFSMFGVHWVILKSVVDLLSGWRNWFGKHSTFVGI